MHQTAGAVGACFAFVDQGGESREPELECLSAGDGEPVTITSRTDHPELFNSVYLTLRGEGTAVVDSISYRVS